MYCDLKINFKTWLPALVCCIQGRRRAGTFPSLPSQKGGNGDGGTFFMFL